MHPTKPHPHPGPPLEGEGAKQGPLGGEREKYGTEVLRLRDISFADAAALLARYGLQLERVADDAPIPGSYWGECEAGLIGTSVHARGDTPVHSLLHEACHLIVLPPVRRAAVHTDATDSVEEEDAVCLLQALLGDLLPGVGRARVLADMDAWGYTFRLGSAAAYFERDAEAAWAWLAERGLVDAARKPVLPDAPVGAQLPGKKHVTAT
ncbi:hypothetical protein GCM10022229_24190 [Luteimonas lutimaris]|uniref:IrrE N-terminal-like domain-containing protein n=1 Tax=Luteimonas lutimaris TaxID=698645 RepID=A0ABP7MT25_9GAMM